METNLNEMQNALKREPSNDREYNRQEVARRIFAPRADIFEDNESVRIFLDAPGVEPAGLEISLEKDLLTLEGRVERATPTKLKLALREYDGGNYKRTFTISESVDRDKISASIKNGVIELVLPKIEEAKPRKIPVTAS